MSLRRLLQSHLTGPYAKLLWLVAVLSAVQTFAALTLPTINADIIDDGVLRGDNATIYRLGAVMLVFTLIQVVFSVGAVWFGALLQVHARPHRSQHLNECVHAFHRSSSQS